MEQTQTKQVQIKQFIIMLVGAFLFALGMNAFIVPMNLFSSGVVGIAQLIRAAIIQYTSINLPANFDVAGLINLMINIPLMIVGYKYISKNFFYKTIFCIAAITFFLTVLNFNTLILQDILTNVLVGGVICGFGVGLILRGGGSGGGFDVVAFILLKKKKGGGVGKYTIYINAIIIVISALMFDLQTAIYTGLYTVIMSFVLDKTHYQNIKVSATIFTRQDDLAEKLSRELVRGVTTWKGAGAYTKEETNVLMVVVSKFEARRLNTLVKQYDPNAFMVMNEGMSVVGNFEQRF